MVGIGQIGKSRARVSAKGMFGQFVKMRMLSGAVPAVPGSLKKSNSSKNAFPWWKSQWAKGSCNFQFKG